MDTQECSNSTVRTLSISLKWFVYYSTPACTNQAILNLNFVFIIPFLLYSFVTNAYNPKQYIFNFTWLFVLHKNGKSIPNGIANVSIFKYLEENIEQYLYDSKLGNNVLNKTQKH